LITGRNVLTFILILEDAAELRHLQSTPISWKELVVGHGNKSDLIVENDIVKTIERLNTHAGAIEYIDVHESNNINIAMSEKDELKYKTHCEIHPSTIFSIYTSTIPFANHNQAPRNIFSGAQGKQALGIYATNFNNRIDTSGYILHYPQKPLVSNIMGKYTHADNLPNGQNLIVAIATYSGFNQEDSIIINKASIDRGVFHITSFKSIIEETVDNINTFGNPKNYNIRNQKYGNYKHINDKGMPALNHKLSLDDCIIGKVKQEIVDVSVSNNDAFAQNSLVSEYVNVSNICDKTTDGYTIDKIITMDGKSVKLRLRKMKIPELGDKSCSRHGQKGVFGMILPEIEMPFTTKEGIRPDIIVNPHAFPSRMTIGHLLECVFAKLYAMAGKTTPFTQFEVTPTHEFKHLNDYGFEKYGDELMCNGRTGEQIETEIFFGPTYYYRLKHMVSDKINYRNKGKMVGLTKQPPKGRSNEGGLRIGEMETNVLVSYGISSFTQESMIERSDGELLRVDNDKKVIVPHSWKLLSQELKAMSIDNEWIYDEKELEEIIEDDDNLDELDNLLEDTE
jgi:DNA-directed RNA polymerase II subunit RPB2